MLSYSVSTRRSTCTHYLRTRSTSWEERDEVEWWRTAQASQSHLRTIRPEQYSYCTVLRVRTPSQILVLWSPHYLITGTCQCMEKLRDPSLNLNCGKRISMATSCSDLSPTVCIPYVNRVRVVSALVLFTVFVIASKRIIVPIWPPMASSRWQVVIWELLYHGGKSSMIQDSITIKIISSIASICNLFQSILVLTRSCLVPSRCLHSLTVLSPSEV